MKKILFIALLSIFSLGLSAQDTGFGAGLIVGEPTGLSGKMWLGANSAVDAGVAWSITSSWLYVHADYLMHSFGLIPVEVGQLPLYYGVGAAIGLGNKIHIGARVPVGLAYLFEGTPLDVFLEVVPGITIIPDMNFYMGGGIGVRYWF